MYIKGKRRDGDVQSRGGEPPTFQGGGDHPLPLFLCFVIMTLVSYFCGLPGVPQKARKLGTISISKVSPSKSLFAETI